jgi:hypothetical protein
MAIEVTDGIIAINLAEYKTIRMFDNNTIQICLEQFNCVTIGLKDTEQTNNLYNKIKLELAGKFEINTPTATKKK